MPSIAPFDLSRPISANLNRPKRQLDTDLQAAGPIRKLCRKQKVEKSFSLSGEQKVGD
jgi:hypothetical protein